MSNTLLATRLDVLLRRAEEVESVMRALNRNQTTVRNTKDAVSGAQTRARLADPAQLSRLAEELERIGSKLTEESDRIALEKAKAVLGDVAVQLTELVTTLGKVDADLDRVVSRHVPFGEAWGESIEQTTSDLKDAIEQLRTSVKTGDKPLPELWKAFTDDVNPRASRLFCDYLDLLGGVSIREHGLTMSTLEEVLGLEEQQVFHLDDLCRMADWHVDTELRRCVDWPQRSVTLPGHERTDNVPSWPVMLCLSFAHWSIWGMALEGHEFGRAVAARLDMSGADFRAARKAFGARGLRVLVADVIAAWTEGPAYACALCFLSLDPKERIKDGRGVLAAADRAYLVEQCLRNQFVHGSDRDPEREDRGYGYLDFVATVGSCWRGSLSAAGASETTRAELLDVLPKQIWRSLRLQRAFKLEDWRLAKQVWAALAADAALPDTPPVGIRHLMNAAWYARLSEDLSPRPKPQDIERRALERGHRLVTRRGDDGRRKTVPTA